MDATHPTRLVTALIVILSVATGGGRQLPAQTTRAGQAAPPAKAGVTKKPTAPSCAKPDTTAAWYKRQRPALDEIGLKWTDDSLRSALLDAAGLTVATALAPQLGWQISDLHPTLSPAESTTVAMLKRRGGRGGRGRGGAPGATAGATGAVSAPPSTPPAAPPPPAWPLKSVVGVAGVRAVFVLIQKDSALQESGKHHMMEAGPDEAVAADVAVLEDRSRLIIGRKQIYGTQLHDVNGKLVPLPMEDSARVDIRRSDAGLPTLKWSVCNANAKI